MLKLLILAAACAGVSHSLCLPCGGSPCQTPVCCKSGEYVKSGYCGCCLQCAKAEGEECGGDWEEKGRCASGMACRYSSPSQGKCRKPRKASGGLGNSQPGPLDINQQPSKPEIIAAPVCPAGKTANDMACHCSKEQAVKGLDGNTRGGCVPSTYHKGETAQGWCFLENIKNPSNGTQNCFEDVKWSVVDGRFWSNLACIEEYKKKEEEKLGIGLQLSNIPNPVISKEEIMLELANIPAPDGLYGQIQTTTEHLEMYTNPPGCPEKQPLFCLPEEEGKTCSYGSQSCCGEITPTLTVECNKKGTWYPHAVFPDIRCRSGYDEC